MSKVRYSLVATEEGIELDSPKGLVAFRPQYSLMAPCIILSVVLGFSAFIAALLHFLGGMSPRVALSSLSFSSTNHAQLSFCQPNPLPLERPLLSTSSSDASHAQLSFCEVNPVLARLNRSQITGLELHWKQWHKASIGRAQQLSVALSNGVPIGQYYRYPSELPQLDHNVCAKTMPGVVDSVRYIAPVDSMLPCPSLSMFGRSATAGDTGKWLCEGDALLNDSNCVVYSLGSNNQFEFEESVLAQFEHCHIFTFDCTSSPPITSIPRLHFEQSCVGDRDALVEGKQYHTLHSLMKANGHHSVSLLKMDIETYEFEVFSGLLSDPYDQQLPYQIAFETHYLHLFGLPAVHLALFERLYYAGYRLVSHENNVQCRSCNEWTVVRVYC